MKAFSALSGFAAPVGLDDSVSPWYIGDYPMTQFTGTAASLSTQSITLSTAGVDTGNDWITGATAATWLVAGTPIRVRNTGTIPTGLSTSTLYYAGKPDADKVSFHLSLADALAGTNKVDITGAGTANVVLYIGVVYDRSGMANHQPICSANNDNTVFASPPYMSSASSGSTDTSLCRLPVATLNSLWNINEHTLVMACRIKPGTIVAGRSIWGCGNPGSHGPRINVDSGGAKATLQMYHSGGTLTIGNSAGTAFVVSVENHVALVLDGPRKEASFYINGVLDLTLNRASFASVGTVLPTDDLRLGGSANNNAHAAGFRDYKLLSIPGEAPSYIDELVASMATTLYTRVRRRT